jgi:hypothetical protein
MTTEVQTIKSLNEVVNSVITAEAIEGFEKAFLIANAAAKLKESLSDDYMKPIMGLQGNKLGFKTDKDDRGGYCYITKEGFGFMLSNIKGLDYEIIQSLPRINPEKTSAAIVMTLEWTYKSEKRTRQIDFAVRMNSQMGVDAVIGKATRKARAWLYNKIKGTEIPDGETSDIAHEVVDPEKQRVEMMIRNAGSLEELESIALEVEADQVTLFNSEERRTQILSKMTRCYYCQVCGEFYVRDCKCKLSCFTWSF